ncbi:MAG: hypothetical protein U0794_16735 [Isosphaeraceae bacterium]
MALASQRVRPTARRARAGRHTNPGLAADAWNTRRLWLVHFADTKTRAHTARPRRVGLVGSVIALFGEATCALSVDDLYGLYCALGTRGAAIASSNAIRAQPDGPCSIAAARDSPDFA